MTQNDINEHSPSELSPNALYKFWTESMKLPTIGPMFAFSKEFTDYANDIVNLGKVVSELKTQNDNYWAMMGAAFARASKLTIENSPRQLMTKEDFENYRRAMIEAFEDTFTELFSSSEFSVAYGKVFSTQLDFSKALQTIAERNSKILNLPTRAEIDEILKDVHELRKSVRDLRKGMEALQNDRTRIDSA